MSVQGVSWGLAPGHAQRGHWKAKARRPLRGSGRGTSINEIYDQLRELTEYPLQGTYGPPKLGEVYRIFLDARKAGQQLGWQAMTRLDAGLARTVEYFRRAQSIEPDDAQALEALEKLYTRNERWPELLEVYRQVVG